MPAHRSVPEGKAGSAGKPVDIDDYIRRFPADVRDLLEGVRRAISTSVPTAEEAIAYQIPAFRVDGKVFVYFGAWAHHLSVYPVPAGDEAFANEVAKYRAGRGTLRFPLTSPPPYEFIGRVAALLAQRGPLA